MCLTKMLNLLPIHLQLPYSRWLSISRSLRQMRAVVFAAGAHDLSKKSPSKYDDDELTMLKVTSRSNFSRPSVIQKIQVSDFIPQYGRRDNQPLYILY